MNQLRQLGRGLRALDDKYSERIQDMYFNSKMNPAVAAIGAGFGGGHPSLRKAIPEDMEDGLAKTALEYGIPAINAVPKYVLPAAGVTMAGKALFDLSYAIGSHFGSKADEPQEDTLTLS